MKHTRIKKVIGENSKIFYYLGDGFWFGRISKKAAESGLASGVFTLWEITVPALDNLDI